LGTEIKPIPKIIDPALYVAINNISTAAAAEADNSTNEEGNVSK